MLGYGCDEDRCTAKKCAEGSWDLSTEWGGPAGKDSIRVPGGYAALCGACDPTAQNTDGSPKYLCARRWAGKDYDGGLWCYDGGDSGAVWILGATPTTPAPTPAAQS